MTIQSVSPPRCLKRESGSALVVSLILLVVLTMLAVQGMRTNVMQERMAGNLRERNLGFQAAEAALRQGEEQGPFLDGNAALAVDLSEWDGTGNTGAVVGFDAALFADPVYHVGPPQYVRVGIGIPPDWRYLYPVTARGVGGQQESVVVVQSSFEPTN